MVEALNFLDDLAPVYFVPGNHEFDRRTPDAVVNAVRQSDFTWLADNLELRTGQADVKNGVRVLFLQWSQSPFYRALSLQFQWETHRKIFQSAPD